MAPQDVERTPYDHNLPAPPNEKQPYALKVQNIKIGRAKGEKKKTVIYALRDIAKDEELAFDYDFVESFSLTMDGSGSVLSTTVIKKQEKGPTEKKMPEEHKEVLSKARKRDGRLPVFEWLHTIMLFAFCMPRLRVVTLYFIYRSQGMQKTLAVESFHDVVWFVIKWEGFMTLFMAILAAVEFAVEFAVNRRFHRTRLVENDDKEAHTEQDDRRRSVCGIRRSMFFCRHSFPFHMVDMCVCHVAMVRYTKCFLSTEKGILI